MATFCVVIARPIEATLERMRIASFGLLLAFGLAPLAACRDSATTPPPARDAGAEAGEEFGARAGVGPGIPVAMPWASFYGPATGVDLQKTADRFRLINLDADPDTDNVAPADVQTLRAGGKNRVISYMNVGACETYRSYYASDPSGHKSCVSSGALTTVYSTEYPDEKWANLSNPAYRDLIVNYVAPRLAAQGVDGFFLDNLEVIEHGATAELGPCDAVCTQGGLDLVWELRQRFPTLLIVMQNGTSDVTRLGTTHGMRYALLLDGISHEEAYGATADPLTHGEMLAWRDMHLTSGGQPFWVGVEEYVGSCSAAAKGAANGLYARAAADGLNAYVTDDCGAQQAPCFWSDL